MRTNKNNADEFVAVPMRRVEVGERFVPIERMGPPIWVSHKHRWEREWRKADRAFVCTGVSRGVDEAGADGIFSLFDWAIVRKRPKPATPASVAKLATKWGH